MTTKAFMITVTTNRTREYMEEGRRLETREKRREKGRSYERQTFISLPIVFVLLLLVLISHIEKSTRTGICEV